MNYMPKRHIVKRLFPHNCDLEIAPEEPSSATATRLTFKKKYVSTATPIIARTVAESNSPKATSTYKPVANNTAAENKFNIRIARSIFALSFSTPRPVVFFPVVFEPEGRNLTPLAQ